MTSPELFGITGVILFGCGLWGVGALVDLIRRIVALNIMSVGVFLILISIAYRPLPQQPDSVPHAMVLTGIVVSVSATALALALVRRQASEIGHDSVPQQEHTKND